MTAIDDYDLSERNDATIRHSSDLRSIILLTDDNDMPTGSLAHCASAIVLIILTLLLIMGYSDNDLDE